MKVTPEQLPDQLAKRLDAGYLVTGDEPLLVQEACDRIRERAVAEGYEERTVFQTDPQFDWQQVHDETQALSLFASRRRIEVRLHSGKPGKGREVLEAFAKAPPEDVILIVSGPRLDSGETSKAWFRNWQKVGLHVPVWPVDPADFPRWLSRRAETMGLKLTRNAVAQLSERLEGNLLAAHQELERLRVVAGDEPVDDAVAIGGVEDSSRYNAFELSAEALSGNRVHALQMLRRLEEEGTSTLAVLGVLQRDLKHLASLQHSLRQGSNAATWFKHNGVRQPPLRKALEKASRRHSSQSISRAWEQARQVDRASKGQDPAMPPWSALAALVETLSA
ncbi:MULTISPECIES: DNA polymerase III subunit delta [Halomonadaceae]|uniref:DNA polymerase III subunit delta n=1 Tax=Vreelandella halophila TaxID=86177 RepID=A0A9X4Y8Q8_9GAMM|nr:MULTISPECIES: DNA polymerase III subunit delta [Halomonas]MYL25472.1 DNA polymerase III subunit delta [Halomonas utahensis]MYL74708.1 DNA polymerase III subunit delta [Halomonas sp. 22501_18_FS]